MAHSRMAVWLGDGVRAFCAVALIVFVTVGFWSGTALSLDWKPEKTIEVIVGTGPGSGVDNTARTLQAVMQTNKMIDQSITVLNKPGGGYGMALNYLGQFPGDGHRLLVQTATPLTSLVAGQLKINYFDLTPIAGLISEPIALMVPVESPIKNGQDLAKRMKADPASVSISFANARGNAYHIACALFARRLGADVKKLKVIVYASSGEAMTALLGRHVDVASATPGAFLPMVEANKIRIIGVASPKRLAGPLASVPTFKEQGIDVVIDSPRSVMGPKGLSDGQIRYWNSLFQRLVKTDMWKQALERNQWEDNYMDSAELGQDLKSQYNMIREIMIELGMAAK
jgi:putative tricarboxylic transport membrane protein